MMNIFTGEIVDVVMVDNEFYPEPELTWYMENAKVIEGSPLIVQQWTGLKDKHGKDIYDGDILNYTLSATEFTDVVAWENNGWVMTNPKKDSSYPISGAYRPTIIGNIFENSDLLNINA